MGGGSEEAGVVAASTPTARLKVDRLASMKARHSQALSLLLLGLFYEPTAAQAGFTLHGSAGVPYILSGGAGVSAERGPLTIDVAPGYEILFVRAELPFVFSMSSGNVYPATEAGLLGVRPQLKFFPLRFLYGKIGTELYFADDATSFFRTAFGLGVEISIKKRVALTSEISVNPFYTPSTILPLEGRVGVTVLF